MEQRRPSDEIASVALPGPDVPCVTASANDNQTDSVPPIRRRSASNTSTCITASACGSLSLARERRQPRDAALDRSAERARAAVPRGDSRTRAYQEAHDRAVELRALRHSGQARRALLLHCATTACRTRACSTSRTRLNAEPRVAARPEHAEQGRDDRARRVRAEPGRQAACLQPVRWRHGLAHLAHPRRGDRTRPARRTALHQVRAGRVDRRFALPVLRALSAARRRLRATIRKQREVYRHMLGRSRRTAISSSTR